MNDRSFEDRERTLEDIFLSLFVKTLYMWAVAYMSHLIISYSDFLVFLLLLVRWFFLYTLCVGARYAFNDIYRLFIKKEEVLFTIIRSCIFLCFIFFLHLYCNLRTIEENSKGSCHIA